MLIPVPLCLQTASTVSPAIGGQNPQQQAMYGNPGTALPSTLNPYAGYNMGGGYGSFQPPYGNMYAPTYGYPNPYSAQQQVSSVVSGLVMRPMSTMQ